MRQRLVAGNWKMNGSQTANEQLLMGIKDGITGISSVEVVVCPPFVYAQQTGQALSASKVALGAQNVSEQDSGAFTGEVSASMLADIGCQYAIVGHSERRQIFAESDALVANKFAAAVRSKVVPILCVGETLEQREQNVTEQVIAQQLDTVIDVNGIDAFANAVVAYEPVWAIGTGKTATPEQAQQVHAFIRNRLQEQNVSVSQSIRILYGGSVKPNNAAELFSQADIDGGLIGGASLQASDFLAICQAAAEN